MKLQDYEKRHIGYLEKNAQESCLFLKRNNKFPLDKPTTLCLVGNGSRNTIKGGTGSGDVASRFFVNALDGFKNAGFTVVSEEWMDKYDAFRMSTMKSYIRSTKKAARKTTIFAGVFSMGFFEEEKNYDFDCFYDADVCVYVLSRNSGEGNDRRNIKGDVKLSDKEVNDILELNKKFDKFLLVLNVGGVVDLSPIMEVENILLLSQLGVVTGTILANIVLGKANPSGKLSTTWTIPENYPYFNEFGDCHDTYYKEGVYVGYRYFESIKDEKPQFYYPFGYGKSYSEFEFSDYEYSVKDETVTIRANIKNVSSFKGKEVLEVYVTSPIGNIDKPYLVLAGFNKTKELEGGESERISVSFDLKSIASYDEKNACYILEKGKYIIRVGNASNNLKDVFTIELKEDYITWKLENKCGKPSFDDLKIERKNEDLDIPNVVIEKGKTKVASYKKHDEIDERLKGLTNEELMLLTLGHHKTGIAAVVGSSSNRLVGGAGETTLSVKSITKSLSMADGPAGLRLIQKYGIDDKGVYNLSVDPIMEKMTYFLPKIVAPFVAPKPDTKRKGEVHYQYTTAIPIGTALAQSFNLEYVTNVADLVREELDIYDCDLWLAPALNIHRNILCGRNFEYFSEDPYLSGMMASAITKGIQKCGNRGTTIKHFACNNQELNRTNNNSHVSERALREIYLKGFEIAINDSNPYALMTSYNLINGVHTSESYELVNDILRCEWGYNGLVMTDWIASGRSFALRHKYPAAYASKNILAGNDLTMSGSPRDEKDIKKALKKGTLSREDLLISASRIYKAIERQRH